MAVVGAGTPSTPRAWLADSEAPRLTDDVRRTLALLSEGVLIISLDGRIIEANDIGASYLGSTRPELLSGVTDPESFEVCDRDGVGIGADETPIGRCRLTRSPVARTRIGIATPLGKRWIECAATPMTTEDGDDVVLATLNDVTSQVDAENALKESEHQFRLLADTAVDIVSLIDPQDGLLYISPAVARVLGYRPDEIDRHEWGEYIHADDLVAFNDLLSEQRGDQVESWGTFRARHKDGREVWLEVVVRDMVAGQDERVRVLAVGRDVTERMQVEHALQASEARWRTAFDHGPIGQALVGTDGVPVAVNRALQVITGAVERQLKDTPLVDRVHPTDRPLLVASIQGAWDGDEDPPDVEVRMSTMDETHRWVRVSVAPVPGDEDDSKYLVIQILDVDQQVRAAHLLRHQAAHDSLTGVLNRATLTTHLQSALRRARPGSNVAVCFVDLDGFKAANDSLGHAAGDNMLVTTAERLAQRARSGDVVGRLGGDEFLVVAEGLRGPNDANALAERLREGFVEPIAIAGQSYVLSASIGVALSDGSDDAVSVLRDADAAMYDAKRRGRSRWQLFDEALAAERVDRFALENDLRQAMIDDRLRLHYQPIVGLGDRAIRAHEALLRVEHPERGLLMPDSFLATAEDSDLIVPMGDWACDAAIQEAARWGVDGPWISVNVSTRQLSEAGLADKVVALLERHNLPASRLVLEVTESALLDRRVDGGDLRRLDALGVRIALDDFGTGYSSLTHLRDLPVKVLKLDRSFISNLGREPGATAIVRAVVELARSLGLHTVAEGVETEEQAELLQSFGCDSAQGYLFGRPTALPHT